MKELRARDVMSEEFNTILPSASMKEVIDRLTELGVRSTGYKGISLIVLNEVGQPTGTLSILDVLFHLRPAFLNYEVNSLGLAWDEMESYIKEFKGLTAEQIMHTPAMTCSPDDLIMQIVDRMVKQRTRRMPVVENDVMIGVVFLSDLFKILSKTWLGLDAN